MKDYDLPPDKRFIVFVESPNFHEERKDFNNDIHYEGLRNFYKTLITEKDSPFIGRNEARFIEFRKFYPDGNYGFDVICVLNNTLLFIDSTPEVKIHPIDETFDPVNIEHLSKLLEQNITQIESQLFIQPIYINFSSMFHPFLLKLKDLLDNYGIDKEGGQKIDYLKLDESRGMKEELSIKWGSSLKVISTLCKGLRDNFNFEKLIAVNERELRVNSQKIEESDYSGIDYWQNDSGVTIDVSKTQKKYKGRVYIAQDTIDFLAHDYVSHILNLKRCSNCDMILPMAYQKTRYKNCTKEDNPKCFQDRQKIRKKKSRKNRRKMSQEVT